MNRWRIPNGRRWPAPEAAAELTISPNPAVGQFTIYTQPAEAGFAELTLVDALGRTVLRQIRPVQTGLQQLPLDVHGVAPEVYLLRFTHGATHLTRRVSIGQP